MKPTRKQITLTLKFALLIAFWTWFSWNLYTHSHARSGGTQAGRECIKGEYATMDRK